MSVEEKTWTEKGELPKQLRWKVSRRHQDRWEEVESDSLFYVIYFFLLLNRIRRTQLWEKKYGRMKPW